MDNIDKPLHFYVERLIFFNIELIYQIEEEKGLKNDFTRSFFEK